MVMRAAFCAMTLALSGCAAVPLAAVSTAASVGKVGVSAFSAGKIEAVEMVGFEDMRAAVQVAVAELSLTEKGARETGSRSYSIWLRDDHGSPVSVHVRRKTETVTRLRIEVGLFGSEPMARLVLRRIHAALVAAGVLQRDELPR